MGAGDPAPVAEALPERPEAIPERVVCRGTGFLKRDLEVTDFEEDEPYTRIHFGPLRPRAQLEPDLDGTRWDVVRAGLLSPTFRLLRNGRPWAEARRIIRSIGRRYRIEWAEGSFDLVGDGGPRSWMVLEEDLPAGFVRPLVSAAHDFDVELPGDTPDEVLLFVASVATLDRASVFWRVAEWACQIRRW